MSTWAARQQAVVDLVDCPHCRAPAGQVCVTPARMGSLGRRYTHKMSGPPHLARREAYGELVASPTCRLCGLTLAAYAMRHGINAAKWHAGEPEHTRCVRLADAS